MRKIEVRLLGPPSVQIAGKLLHIPRRQTRALLYRLATILAPVPREHLCFLLWSNRPEQEARRNLSHLLTHLRNVLDTPDAIETNDDTITLVDEFVWSDAHEFLHERNGADEIPAVDTLYRLSELYRGPLLTGFSLPSSPEFEAWLTLERQNLERIYLETLALLIELQIRQENYAEAIEHANNYLFVNNFDEEMHRRLMELYSITGNRGAALHQYQRCADILRRDLGLRPCQSIRELYLRVLRDQVEPTDMQARVEQRLLTFHHHRPHRPLVEYPHIRVEVHPGS